MKSVTMETFESEVIKADQPVIVDVWAEWCGPCRYLTPILEDLERESPDVKFVKLNADENSPLLQMFGISHVPTIMRFDNGKKVREHLGYAQKHILRRNLEI